MNLKVAQAFFNNPGNLEGVRGAPARRVNSGPVNRHGEGLAKARIIQLLLLFDRTHNLGDQGRGLVDLEDGVELVERVVLPEDRGQPVKGVLLRLQELRGSQFRNKPDPVLLWGPVRQMGRRRGPGKRGRVLLGGLRGLPLLQLGGMGEVGHVSVFLS